MRALRKNTGHEADLIGARVGNIDDPCSLLGLQIGDEGSLEGLGLAHDILLVTSTGQSQQQTVICLHLGQRKLSVIKCFLTKHAEAYPTQGIWPVCPEKPPKSTLMFVEWRKKPFYI